MKQKIYHFHSEWEEDIFFSQCRIRNVFDLSISHRYSKEKKCRRHFQTVHKIYDIDIPSKSEMRKKKVTEL